VPISDDWRYGVDVTLSVITCDLSLLLLYIPIVNTVLWTRRNKLPSLSTVRY
jgi:hypothetical protein